MYIYIYVYTYIYSIYSVIFEALEAVLGGHEGRGGAAVREHGWSLSGLRQHVGLFLGLGLGV